MIALFIIIEKAKSALYGKVRFRYLRLQHGREVNLILT